MSLEQTEFDYIVLGTGLVESILAAAISKSGRSVLHVDDAAYYGGKWASHSFGDLLSWLRSLDSPDNETAAPVSLNGLILDGETTVAVDALTSRSKSFGHVEFQYWPSIVSDPSENGDAENTLLIDMAQVDSPHYARDTIARSLDEQFDNTSKNMKEAIDYEVNRLVRTLAPTSSVTVDIRDSVARIRTLKEALDASRHYNFDLTPKVLSCRGEMVEVLIKSGIGRYLEFKGVEQSYVFDSEVQSFNKVPVSKEDVFSTDSIALIDKRKLMRFLTFAMSEEADPQILEEYGTKPYKVLLEEKFKINGKLQLAIIYAIALVQDDVDKVTAAEGLERTRTFLNSLGRYGRCAFLRPLYGGASEIAQAFCRACAVHGGIYMLNQPIKKYLLSEDKTHCLGVVTGDSQQLTSKWIIGGMEYMNPEWVDKEAEVNSTTWIARAILVSNEPPIVDESTEKEDIRFAVFPPNEQEGIPKPVTILQLSNEGMTCPRQKYMTFLSTATEHSDTDAKSDLQAAISKLLANNHDIQPLFLLYYKQRSQSSSIIASDKIPNNVIACSDPDEVLDLDKPLAEAVKAFIRCCGEDEEFLPAPEVDPEFEE